MNKRRVGTLMALLGLVAILAGVGLVQYNLWDSRRAGEEANEALEYIEQYRDWFWGSDEEPYGNTVEKPDIPDFISNPWMELPTVMVGEYLYVGTLTVPALELELPVMDTWSYPLLKKAPCRYYGTPYRGNLIICAHNYDTHFGRLKNLQQGDELIFTDVIGNTFYYFVEVVEILQPTAIEEMHSGDWDMTLFTCTLGGQTRVTVRCFLSEVAVAG